jgi:hypothetical protein
VIADGSFSAKRVEFGLVRWVRITANRIIT